MKVIAKAGNNSLFLCPGCGRYKDARLVKDGGERTEEHIIPKSLGNEKWSIAMCKDCNSLFNEKFDNKFISNPDIILARNKSHKQGRRSLPGRTRFELFYVSDIEHRMETITSNEGILRFSKRILPFGTLNSNPNFIGAPEEFKAGQEFMWTSIESDLYVRLGESLKILLEQLYYHFGESVNNNSICLYIQRLLRLERDDFLDEVRNKVMNEEINYLNTHNYIHTDDNGKPHEFQLNVPSPNLKHMDSILRGVLNNRLSSPVHSIKVRLSFSENTCRLIFTADLFSTIISYFSIKCQPDDFGFTSCRKIIDTIGLGQGRHTYEII